jgi:hypothetical protein
MNLPGVRNVVSALRRVAFDSVARSELTTRLQFRNDVHQTSTLSFPNRYPRLFAAARELLADVPAPSLLSFGCAAGEEVVTLQEYFPEALVTGAEINRAKLRACRRLAPHLQRRFIASTPDAIAKHGPYDAIFCMAVLTRRPHHIEDRGVRNIAGIYPFDRFAEELKFLVGQLEESGLLVVEHALYRVEDVANLSVVPVFGPGTYLAKGPRFDALGEMLEPSPVISRIFRKVSK